MGTYLSQGWQKLVEPAAVALATALAMGLVELAMELGFKGIGKGLKKAGTAVKNGAKATVKGVKAAAHAGASGIKSLLKSGAKLVSKSGSMIIRKGKIVIQSLQKGFMKGVKKLQGLIGQILKKFKFKRFKLERKGKHIRLYGEVNPWVLLADGTIEKVESLDGRKAGISTTAEFDKLNSLKISDRVDVYKRAEASGGKIDFEGIQGPGIKVYPKRELTPAEKIKYQRPYKFRKNIRDKVWDTAKGEGVDVIDPLTKKIMNKKEHWDMGHKPGYEFRKHQRSAAERGITRKQFLDEHNNSDHYVPELPSSNRGHKLEDDSDSYLGS